MQLPDKQPRLESNSEASERDDRRPTFSELFCTHCRLRPDQFLHRCFWHSVHLRQWILVAPLFLLRRELFDDDLRLIEEVGSARNEEEASPAIQRYRQRLQPRVCWWQRLGARVSSSRLRRLVERTFSESDVGSRGDRP